MAVPVNCCAETLTFIVVGQTLYLVAEKCFAICWYTSCTFFSSYASSWSIDVILLVADSSIELTQRLPTGSFKALSEWLAIDCPL